MLHSLHLDHHLLYDHISDHIPDHVPEHGHDCVYVHFPDHLAYKVFFFFFLTFFFPPKTTKLHFYLRPRRCMYRAGEVIHC